jgi:hypothetical protein
MSAAVNGRMMVLALAGLLLAGCLGPLKYGSLADNNGLGYRDTQNPDGSYTILVIAYDPTTAQQFWDRRAQELCGGTNFHKNIFRAEVPVVRYSGYASNPMNPTYGGSYSEDRHGNFYLEGYLRCQGDATGVVATGPDTATETASPATVTP